jgi:hypothetical protein
MKFREEADYYENLREEAESLAVRVRAFLRQEGHLPVE